MASRSPLGLEVRQNACNTTLHMHAVLDYTKQPKQHGHQLAIETDRNNSMTGMSNVQTHNSMQGPLSITPLELDKLHPYQVKPQAKHLYKHRTNILGFTFFSSSPLVPELLLNSFGGYKVSKAQQIKSNRRRDYYFDLT